MLSCVRKVIEAAMARRLARSVPINPRQFGFQRGLSSMITLVDVNAQGRACLDKIATLDLCEAYNKVNRVILWKDCKKVVDSNLCSMLTACLQTLSITTKDDVTEIRMEQRMGLTQGAPLSPVLFLVYINNITRF